ncbi:monovalent cation/H(+) antiporter subunit G [Amphritea japonica]|uniref:Multicomponent Na+:H+ antiporter subunit G n=1 Tax=Amphritea japonica ATCC BAA-1530 TaxID=1278309 RepID=A0A7R6SSD3_9GAMM|nr:monovalent cation/H(+) antiporter subunit G [Amphritea japonica]BBB26125.1 multicomponent Na+:H+ antiporter subunit G [Amphritea japonica ATCC BAA-1530]
MDFLDIVSSILLLAGVFFGLSGAVGLFRFPDFFTRIHAASVTDSIAAILIIGGLLLQTSFDLNTAKLVFILLFLMVTSPTASHALAKSARHGGLLTLAETNPQDKQESAK